MTSVSGGLKIIGDGMGLARCISKGSAFGSSQLVSKFVIGLNAIALALQGYCTYKESKEFEAKNKEIEVLKDNMRTEISEIEKEVKLISQSVDDLQ